MTVLTANAFRRLKFNPGEQVYAEDFNRLQRQLLMRMTEMFQLPRIGNLFDGDTLTVVPDPEQVLYTLGKSADASRQPTDMAFCPFPAAAQIGPGAGARELTPLVAGPLTQLVRTLDDTADFDDDDPALLTYWIKQGEFTLTCAVGDATNPRIDVVEMKLELVDGPTETRVYSQESVRATLDLGPMTTHVDTILRAVNGGLAGNSISLNLVPDGAGVGSFTNSGNAYEFHFEDAITTVANFEAAVAALVDAPFEIDTLGTGANVLGDPSDSTGFMDFTGGTDQILIGSNLVKSTIVQATFQIKQGTPAATPAIPACTAGFVPVMAVRVTATFNAVFTDQFIDMRMPLGGIRVFDSMPRDFVLGSSWALDDTNWNATATGGGDLRVLCPTGSHLGRVVAVGMLGELPATPDIDLQRVHYNSGASPGSPPTFTDLGDMGTLESDLVSFTFAWASALEIGDRLATALGYGTRVANTRAMMPLWSDGGLYGPLAWSQSTARTRSSVERLCLRVTPAPDSYVNLVRWVVAFGMG